MKRPTNDQERLIRLRERQLRARDPQAKDRRTQHIIADRHRKSVKKLSLGMMLSEIPARWLGAILGATAGTLVGILLPSLIEATWAGYLVVPAIVVLAMFGYILGRAFDSRNELRDLMRR